MNGVKRHLVRAIILGVVGIVVGFVANPEGLRLERTRREPSAAPVVPPPVVSRIDANLAKSYLGRADVIFLDARDGRDYVRGHVPGSLPLVNQKGESLVASMRPWLHAGARIILYAGAPPDVRASLRATELRSVGFPRVQVIEGGFDAWRRAGGARVEGWDADALLAAEVGR